MSQGPQAASTLGAHLPVLDGVRGAAILLVMMHHFAPKGEAALSLRGLSLTHQVGEVLCRVPRSGWCGVDLFFVLSGFLITGILLDARSSAGFFRVFYTRRALRVFPLYYGVLLAVLIVLPRIFGHVSPEARRVLAQPLPLWTYAVNCVIARNGTWVFGGGLLELNHFWSLSIEEQFYLLWPLAVWGLGRRRLMGLCGGLVALAAAVRLGLALRGAPWESVYTLTACRMDALAAGAWLAAAARGPGGLAALRVPARVVLCCAGAGLAGLAAAGGSWSFPREGVVAETTVFTLLALFCAALLAVSLQAPAGGWAHRSWSHPVLRFFGKYSYGLYVFHSLLDPTFDRLFPARVLKLACHSYLLGAALHVALAVACSLAAAILSWHLYEKHFLSLKRLVEYGKAHRRHDAGKRPHLVRAPWLARAA